MKVEEQEKILSELKASLAEDKLKDEQLTVQMEEAERKYNAALEDTRNKIKQIDEELEKEEYFIQNKDKIEQRLIDEERELDEQLKELQGDVDNDDEMSNFSIPTSSSAELGVQKITIASFKNPNDYIHELNQTRSPIAQKQAKKQIAAKRSLQNSFGLSPGNKPSKIKRTEATPTPQKLQVQTGPSTKKATPIQGAETSKTPEGYQEESALKVDSTVGESNKKPLEVSDEVQPSVNIEIEAQPEAKQIEDADAGNVEPNQTLVEETNLDKSVSVEDELVSFAIYL